MDNTIIIIPAKSNSRRLPNKNILKLGDRTLLRRAVNRSFDSDLGNIIVSRDSDDFYKLIIDWMHPKIFFHNRQKELCKDNTRVWEVLIDVIDWYEENYANIDTVIMTLPTSPFCTPNDIKNAYQMFLDSNRKPVMSITKCQFNPNSICAMIDNELKPFDDEFHGIKWYYGNITDKRNAYLSNGAIWICDTQILREEREQYIDGMLGYEMDEIHGLDINTKLDYLLAQKLIEEGLVN